MKLKYEFVERLIVDEYVLVPAGEAARTFGGMITTSEVGAAIMRALKQDVSQAELLALLMEEYDVDAQTANSDLNAFVQQLRELNVLED
jgi:hypothetical protein